MTSRSGVEIPRDQDIVLHTVDISNEENKNAHKCAVNCDVLQAATSVRRRGTSTRHLTKALVLLRNPSKKLPIKRCTGYS